VRINVSYRELNFSTYVHTASLSFFFFLHAYVLCVHPGSFTVAATCWTSWW
jgi:hypothetical protein